MRDVNEAYDVLRDQEKRQAYDNLAAGVSPDGGFQPPPAGTRVSSSTGGGAPATGAIQRVLLVPVRRRAAAWASSRTSARAAKTMRRSRWTWRTRCMAPPRHQPALDAHGRSRPTADEHAHLERAHSGGRARRPVHPPGRAGHAGLRRRRESDLYLEVRFSHMRAIASRAATCTCPCPWRQREAALGAQVERPRPGRGGGVHPRGRPMAASCGCAAEAYLAIRLATCIWCWNWRCRQPTPRPPSRPIARCSGICPSTRAGTWEPEHEESRHRQRHRLVEQVRSHWTRTSWRTPAARKWSGWPAWVEVGISQRRRRPPGRMAVS